jgi:hypothetical protein
MTDILTRLAALQKDMSVLIRNQPCGCIICECSDEESCHGCGAKNCGTHSPGDFPEGGIWTFRPSLNETALVALVREAAGEIKELKSALVQALNRMEGAQVWHDEFGKLPQMEAAIAHARSLLVEELKALDPKGAS